MTLIKWKKEYDTNLVEINHQHLELMHLLNELNIKYINGYKTSDLIEILNKLSNYALTHFATEEKFFDKYNYPHKDIHIEDHNHFIRKIEYYKDELQNNQTDFFKDMLNFLTAWLNDHLLNMDKKYIQYFKDLKINLMENNDNVNEME